MNALVVVAILALLLLARAFVCAWALVGERRRIPALQPGCGPALSVVIPLFGWDTRFLDLLDGLDSAARCYGSPVEVIVVVNDDHPHRAEIALKRVRLVAPSVVVAPGGIDRMRRLRCGVHAARHPWVMLMDSDVLVDDGFLLRCAAGHVADPTLRLAFALPSFRFATNVGDKTLAAFTLYHNLFLYFLGWWLTRAGTSIGPAQLVRNDDGVLAALLDELRDSSTDDHSLGRCIELRGERVRALPFAVVVHASDPSVGAAARQVLRWMTSSRAISPMLTALSALWLGVAFLISGVGTSLLLGAAVAGAAGAVDVAVILGAGSAVLLTLDALLYSLLEALMWSTKPRFDALWRVPAFQLATPLLFVRSLLSRPVQWRRT